MRAQERCAALRVASVQHRAVSKHETHILAQRWCRVVFISSESRVCVQQQQSAEAASATVALPLVPAPPPIMHTFSVWYVFWLTPQHMPLLLLFTMPPTIHESMEAGSGPSLYCTGCPCLRWCPARIRFTYGLG